MSVVDCYNATINALIDIGIANRRDSYTSGNAKCYIRITLCIRTLRECNISFVLTLRDLGLTREIL